MTASTDSTEQTPPAIAPRRRARPTVGMAAVWVAAAFGAAYVARPQKSLLEAPRPFAALTADAADERPFAEISVGAFERSGNVRMRFTLPGGDVAIPLTVVGDTAALAYAWIPVRGGEPVAARPLTGASSLVAPTDAGFYRLALEKDGRRQLVDDVTLSVLVPFGEKKGGKVNGFAIGTYVGEQLQRVARAALPDGFFPVEDEALALQVSKHLKLRDVLTTPDTRTRGFPQYATIDTRLIEKLELVLAELERMTGAADVTPRISVNSGFRPPSYNATVKGAARNSRHQYGDAADVKIDLNRDGRFTLDEVRLVARAVEAVERAHPDLVGGMGVYLGKQYSSPYVHIDARGSRARWNGAG